MSDKIGLRADNQQYVSADLNQGGILVANRNQISDWESFDLIKLDANKFGLRAANKQYVSSNFNQGGILIANRDVLDGWETFEFVNSSPQKGNEFEKIVSRQFYEAMFPNRNSLYSYDALVSATQKYLSFCNEGSDVQCKREAAAFLANIAHETGELQHVEELNTANWPHYCDPANNTYPCVQGKTYHGRGPIQLSWNYNYGACGAAIRKDLLNKPELVSTDSSISWLTALWFWMTPQGQENLRCHDAIRNFGFGKTISIINGGLECGKGQVTPQAQHRIQLYEQFTRELDVTPGENLSC